MSQAQIPYNDFKAKGWAQMKIKNFKNFQFSKEKLLNFMFAQGKL